MKTITLEQALEILDRWQIMAMCRTGVGVKRLEFNAAELKYKVTHIIYGKGNPTANQKTYINPDPIMSIKKYNEIAL